MDIEQLQSAGDVDAFLQQFYAPRVPWERLSGTLHICAMAQDPNCDGLLRNIIIGSDAPQSIHDFFTLNLGRALAHGIIQSGANMRAEGGFRVEMMDPFVKAMTAWRAARRGGSDPHPASSAADNNNNVVALLTTGKGLDPQWMFFSRADSASTGEVVFSPRIATMSGAAAGIRHAFTSSGAPVPPIIECPKDVPDLSAGTVADYLSKALLDDRGSSAFPDGRPLICIECGPTTTRPLYTQRPTSAAATTAAAEMEENEAISGAAAMPAAPVAGDGDHDDDVLHWVRAGPAVPASACDVEWWMLSTFRGAIKPQALGAPLVRREVVDAIFERCCVATATTADGEWTFELLHNRCKPWPQGWPLAALEK